MAGNDKKKQRQEAKRKEKRREIRKRASVSPVKRLADARGELECWSSAEAHSYGQISLLIYKQGSGVSGMAAFLVDLGVVGLKDAWTRVGMDRLEFAEAIRASGSRGIPMRRVTVDEVRGWIAGGVRWATLHGMRLTTGWEKVAAVIGGIGDWKSADVSKFRREFAGHPQDLRQRLIGETFESFTQRRDIQFIFNEDAPYSDPLTGEYAKDHGYDDDEMDFEEDDDVEPSDELVDTVMLGLLERFSPAATLLAQQTTAWLPPSEGNISTEIFEAWRSIMIGRYLSKLAMPDADENEVADTGYEMIMQAGKRLDPSRAEEHHRAIGQALSHLGSDVRVMEKAMLSTAVDVDPE